MRITGRGPAPGTVSVSQVAITGVHAKGNEYLTLKNRGPVSVKLKGWVLTTKGGHRVTLPTATLAPGATLHVHSGKGKTRGQDLYLGKKAMFGDRHDVVTLTATGGFRAARFTY